MVAMTQNDFDPVEFLHRGRMQDNQVDLIVATASAKAWRTALTAVVAFIATYAVGLHAMNAIARAILAN